MVTPDESSRRAGITTFEADAADRIASRLRESGVIVAVREGRVRVSTHYYNNEGDLERLLQSLPPPGVI